ncbi:BolA/IbaG family iron-sulfur metabolism protein [Corallococcus exiguus]|uniref:BolA family protein n=1 Tax=Corallococcus TaxID=83461 RepID=UPI000EA11648|nr:MULTISPECIES: BolA/IbaG family iron-sulfur metabolism protein [Corallococcus]NNB87092.1 BolA/IbaG family iron-sulfur metabolism protein [Corallococcus exiguus]NNC06736.1 BolA/IbaG family iron-sulfur metabolism protein [Corallococcus exiguus]NNC20726.1 BolA/IbaG family iron-sulfur metabolism protein [Corallococcus exiguus]NPC50536.1 BolA/IbaG family iron-sulfur metabolism protein [Corallococcus exiguus]NRD57083.1 BolA/IbaG family iron-sulfur metabolism protein [Corallococcus exiguus]
MLDAEALRRYLLDALPGSEVEFNDTTGTGDHFEARVVSPAFTGKTMVEQHQLVYAPLQQWLKSGELHALALKTYSPEQWKKLGPR